MSERSQRLTDAHIDVVLPRIPAGIATHELTAILFEARNAINVFVEGVGLRRCLELRRCSWQSTGAGEEDLVRIVRVLRDVDEIVLGLAVRVGVAGA